MPIDNFQRLAHEFEKILFDYAIAEQSSKRIDTSALYSLDVGRRSVLVDPINSAPYVYERRSGMIHGFDFDRRSGTEHQRARCLAQLKFNNLEK